MKIKKIQEVSPEIVYAISTTTGTFIADGLAHHNCVGCNVFQAGNYPIFSHKLDQEDPTLRPRLREKASQTKQWKSYELEELIESLKLKIKQINK